MSSKPACLFEATSVPAAETTVYTSGTAILTLVDKFSGCNTSGSAITVTVKLVPAGGSPGTGNIFVNERTLLAGESYGFPEIVGQKLAPGGMISVLPSATGLNLRGSGTLVGI